MIPLDAQTVAHLAGGELAGDAAGVTVTGAAADSRAVAPGDLFVAIPGERVDGHDFIVTSAAAGAVLALSTRPSPDLPVVVVADPVAALGRLARGVLDRLPGVDVVGITGSSGKTSTKDLLAGVLGESGPVVAPVGSFNTEIGLPLTVLGCDEATQSLVLEMGARGIGHIEYLCDIGRPRVGIVLNVGSAHLGEFGSREAIAKAKQELPASLPADGTAVLNADDPLVRRMADATSAQVLTFGTAASADVRLTDLSLDDDLRPSFALTHEGAAEPVTLLVAGAHNALNAAAVAAAAIALGMSLPEVCAALGRATISSKWRMAIERSGKGVTIINDAYNANPDSMAAALKALAEMGRRRDARTWAVLGEMRELGDESTDAHDAIGRLVVRLNIGGLVVVGDGARAIHLGAAHEGSWAGESRWVPDVAAATDVVVEEVAPGDIVLVKASRAVELERVAEALRDRA